MKSEIIMEPAMMGDNIGYSLLKSVQGVVDSNTLPMNISSWGPSVSTKTSN